MLRCRNLTVRPGGDPAAKPILREASARFKAGAMNAVIGPSGCGKTTLVKAMIGLVPVDAGGEVWFDDSPVRRPEDLLGRAGFAPQFSIAQPKLTVEECLGYALELCERDPAVRAERIERVLEIVGLAEHRGKRVEALSGGQLRRLGLGIELTVDPPALVCDEVTSGLDPISENTILDVLGGQARERGKTILCIIHNLAKLDRFDWITVVYFGEVVFQGDLPALRAHFGVSDAVRLYDALNARTPEHWRELWAGVAGDGEPPAEEPAPVVEPIAWNPPDLGSQTVTLLRRRLRLFFRDHGYLFLFLAITFGFPVMVVIFALDGLPRLSTPSLEPIGASVQALQERVAYAREAAHTASLVTGLIMFQVILLTLMGANNSAREIAAERLLYEKERLCGLRPDAYVLAKLIFTGALAAGQGLWMMAFVKVICEFPGPWLTQGAVLALACVAMTWVCLAFSALMTSAEKASTLAIYLVGFQLPLSGVVLALPAALVWVCRPFINAYWGWAGYLSSMIQSPLYSAFTFSEPDAYVASPWLSGAVLTLHAALGAGAAFWGCRQRKWYA